MPAVAAESDAEPTPGASAAVAEQPQPLKMPEVNWSALDNADGNTPPTIEEDAAFSAINNHLSGITRA